jgi:hypothetical protein
MQCKHGIWKKVSLCHNTASYEADLEKPSTRHSAFSAGTYIARRLKDQMFSKQVNFALWQCIFLQGF